MTPLIIGTAGKLMPHQRRIALTAQHALQVRAAPTNASLAANCGTALREGSVGGLRGRTLERGSRRRPRFGLGIGRGGPVAAVRHTDVDEDDSDVSPDGRPGRPPPGHRWRRVMLKLSGEALAGSAGFGIDTDIVGLFAAEVAESAKMGMQIAVVVGGGNFFRGKDREGKGLDRASADYMGMLATVMNAIQLQATLEAAGVPTRVQTAIDMKEVAEPYIRRRAIRHLEKGRVVIFAAGTGNPFFTTDTGAALRAAEIGAEALLKATKVDGVFERDPHKYPDARMHAHLTYDDVVVHQELNVMDTTAITLCKENCIPVVVFNVFKPGNIVAAVRGDDIGTRVDDIPDKHPTVAQASLRVPLAPLKVGLAGTGGIPVIPLHTLREA